MCEKNKCRHRAEGFCACPPVKNREENFLTLLEHMAVNMMDIRWELDYTDIYDFETVCRQKAERYEK